MADSATIPSTLGDYLRRSSIALAVGDANDDNHLLYVNHHFVELTGYASEEVVGKNCRFLQRGEPNKDARAIIHRFFDDPDEHTVRTPIINFRRDGTPFVNLLFMSKLMTSEQSLGFIFASQFDVSRTRPDMLEKYDHELARALSHVSTSFGETSVILEGSLRTIANSAQLIAQAKLTLGDLDGR